MRGGADQPEGTRDEGRPRPGLETSVAGAVKQAHPAPPGRGAASPPENRATATVRHSVAAARRDGIDRFGREPAPRRGGIPGRAPGVLGGPRGLPRFPTLRGLGGLRSLCGGGKIGASYLLGALGLSLRIVLRDGRWRVRGLNRGGRRGWSPSHGSSRRRAFDRDRRRRGMAQGRRTPGRSFVVLLAPRGERRRREPRADTGRIRLRLYSRRRPGLLSPPGGAAFLAFGPHPY